MKWCHDETRVVPSSQMMTSLSLPANVCGSFGFHGGWNELTTDGAHARGGTVVHTQLI